MIELDIDKESSFTLQMQIDGHVDGSKPPQMRFSIVSEGFTLAIPAKRVDNGVYEINCPKLKGILEAGDYEAQVEVIVDEKHFVPMTEKLRLKQEVKPTVTMIESKQATPAPEVKVGISMGKIEQKAPVLKKMDETIKM